VRATLAGEEAAGDALARRYYPRVLAYLTHRLGDQDQARDLAQDAFYSAFRALHQLRTPRLFAAWLYRIVATTVAAAARRERRELPLLPLDALEKRPHPPATAPPRLTRLLLTQALAALASTDRLILVMDGVWGPLRRGDRDGPGPLPRRGAQAPAPCPATAPGAVSWRGRGCLRKTCERGGRRDRSAERSSAMMTDEEVRRLLRESDPELPEDPPGQAELLAWLAREMRRRLRLDRLWVLAVALPLKGILLQRALRPQTRGRPRTVALIAVGAL